MAPYIIAHRGDSDVRPENTLSSFSSALNAIVLPSQVATLYVVAGGVVVSGAGAGDGAGFGLPPLAAAAAEGVSALSGPTAESEQAARANAASAPSAARERRDFVMRRERTGGRTTHVRT